MVTEPFVARCACCGTSYTSRAWYWLEPIGAIGDDRRQCAVPGCCAALQRGPVALRIVLWTAPDNDAPSTLPTNNQERNRQ